MNLTATLARLFNLTPDDLAQGAIEFDGDEMTGDTGFLSYRPRLRVKRPDGSQLHLFVKLSDRTRPDLGELKEFSDRFSPRECLFYGCLAPMLQRTAEQFGLGSLGLPLVHQELVSDTGTLLVMEDLSHAGFELAPAAMNAEEIRCLIETTARLQAAFWLTRARLGSSAEGMFAPYSPLTDAFGSLATMQSQLEKFLFDGFVIFRTEFAKYLTCPKRVAVINAYLDDDFLDKARRVMKINQEPEQNISALSHRDMWYNNFMIRKGSEGQPLECRVLDWQFFSIGGLAFDFGPLWISSVDNAIAVAEFLPTVRFFYESVRSQVEGKISGLQQFPITAEQFEQQAIESLHWGIAWVVLSAGTMWAFKSVQNVLANAADMIEHFKL